MSAWVVPQLIRKDLQLYRWPVVLSTVAGAGGLLVLPSGGQTMFVVGAVWFFTALCVLASMLPALSVVNERKKQTLTFIMSLPVSAFQYSVAKASSTLGMFLVPWLTLLILALTGTRLHLIPSGSIPILFISALLPAIGFCLIFGASLLGESEAWFIAANIVCNSSYGLVWYLLSRIPSLIEGSTHAVPVWNPAQLMVLGLELLTITLILGATFFLQSRKRDFI